MSLLDIPPPPFTGTKRFEQPLGPDIDDAEGRELLLQEKREYERRRVAKMRALLGDEELARRWREGESVSVRKLAA